MTSVEDQLEEADRRYQAGAEILGGEVVLLFVLLFVVEAVVLGSSTCQSPQSAHFSRRLSTRLLTLANPWIQSGRQGSCQPPQQRNSHDSCEQFTESMVLSQRITLAREHLL